MRRSGEHITEIGKLKDSLRRKNVEVLRCSKLKVNTHSNELNWELKQKR